MRSQSIAIHFGGVVLTHGRQATIAAVKSVVQRVRMGKVVVDGEVIAAIETGVVVLCGVCRDDTEADADATAAKIAGLRIFASERKPMDRSLLDVGGACLLVSQFTLAGTVTKGRRPSFDRAADPSLAEPLYLRVAAGLRDAGVPVQTGRFGAAMQVQLTNDGPATLLVCTADGACV